MVRTSSPDLIFPICQSQEQSLNFTAAVRQLAASRVEFDDIMAFDLEAQLAAHDGV